MGGVEVTAVDQNGKPLPGVTFSLVLFLETAPRDVQVTGSSGIVTLDPHAYFCLPIVSYLGLAFTVVGFYQGQQQAQVEYSNLQCFAPGLTFKFNAGGPCAGGGQCPTGFQCVGGVCVPINPPQNCSNTNPCPTGYTCINGVCILNKPPAPNYSIVGVLAVVAAGVGVYLWRAK